MSGTARVLVLTWPAGAGVREEDPPPPSAATRLALRAQAGDDGAFDELMRATEERVLAIAWRLLGTREEARDAAQESFLRAYRHLRRFQPNREFEAWLYRIVLNVCRDHFRRRRRSASVTVPSASTESRSNEPSAPATSEDELLQAERRSLVLAALETLPARQRAALVLRDLEGRTSEEVAAILGTTAGTVRSQLAAARSRLKIAIVRLASRRREPR
jgi:RNA polymerase sigma-70 factor (ECF subfamily)